MPRISKSLAESIAFKMTEAKRNELKECKLQTQLLAYAITKQSLPKEVLDAYRSYPKYFRTLSYRNFMGGGFNMETIYFPDHKVLPYNDSYVVQASEEDGAELLRLYDKCQLAEGQYRSLKQDLKNAVLSIGTYHRLYTEFPEAAVFLPPATTALAINLPDLLKRL